MEVAPLVGAWIEIMLPIADPQAEAQSLLSWERGLKYRPDESKGLWCGSLLSWERGLKLKPLQAILRRFCRSSRGSVD